MSPQQHLGFSKVQHISRRTRLRITFEILRQNLGLIGARLIPHKDKSQLAVASYKCSVCHVGLTENNCRPSIFKKGSGYCNKCINEWQKRWYWAHPEAGREKRRKYWTIERRIARRKEAQEFKKLAISHYSNGSMACANPFGEHAIPYRNLLALTIDHIGGGGSRHRLTTRYWSFYKWLARQGYPDGFQVLCMNCQLIKKIVNNEMKSELLEREGQFPGLNTVAK